MSDADEAALRLALVEQARILNASGLNQGTSGNLSVRCGEAMLITPSATPYETMTPATIARMPLGGDGAFEGPLKPSTEWRFHRDILSARPDVGAVVHAHPTFATALAMARRDIPACHYMIAAFGGPTIRCAPYATFGTAEFSAYAVEALAGRQGCLLANHGMIAAGPSLSRAMWLAVELETLARQYWHALQLEGGPVILDDDEIARNVKKFGDYGRA